MKHLAFASALALALIPAGCATTNGSLSLTQVVQDAVLAAEAVCAVAPSAESITQIILAATGNAAAQLSEATATQAAAVFCGSVTGKPAIVSGRRTTARKAVARALANGTTDFGTITIGGKTIAIIGTPVAP